MRKLVYLSIAVAVAVAAYAAYWFHAAGALEDGIAAWADAERRGGATVAWRTVSVGGFPLEFAVELEAPRYGRAGAPVAWTWEGERLGLRAPVFGARDRIPLLLPATSRLVYDAGAGQALATIAATAAAGEVRLAPDGAVERIALFFADPRIEADGGVLAAERATLGLALPDRAAAPAPAATDPNAAPGPGVLLTVDRLVLPSGQRPPPLGREITRLEVEAMLRGAVPAAPLRQAVAGWRDGGGTVDVRRLAMQWGALELVAEGTLALDRELQPTGATTARIGGFRETIDTLAANGAINMRDATTAKSALSLLARPAADTGRPEIRVPLTVQQSTLYLGPVTLLRLPPIAW